MKFCISQFCDIIIMTWPVAGQWHFFQGPESGRSYNIITLKFRFPTLWNYENQCINSAFLGQRGTEDFI